MTLAATSAAGAAGSYPHRASSSPDLSSPPSMISAPTSPNGVDKSKHAANGDDATAGHDTSIRYDGAGQPLLTKDGMPRKKPGPKPGTKIGKRSSSAAIPEDGSKPKRQRKPKDPNAPPVQRKRKSAPLTAPDAPEARSRATSLGASAAPMVAANTSPTHQSATLPRQSKITDMASPLNRLEPLAHKAPKREGLPGSMSNILNADPEPDNKPRPAAPSRPSGSMYDPIRSSYDPIRGTFSSTAMSSPKAPSSSVANRASASPSITSLIDPPGPSSTIVSPVQGQTPFAQGLQKPSTQSRRHDEPASKSASRPASPNPFRKDFAPPLSLTNSGEPRKSTPLPTKKPTPSSEAKKNTATETPTQAKKATSAESKKATPSAEPKKATPSAEPKKAAPSTEPKKPSLAAFGAAAAKIEIRPSSITTIGAAGPKKSPPRNGAGPGSPKMGASKDGMVTIPKDSERSILDFGKAEGNPDATVSIVLDIPLNGETNKYVNFMRLAEERYGWEALHPRQAEQKARKARIAAASAALAQNDSSKEGDEMSVDESENEDSNVEMGGMSGPDKPVEGKRKKKRHFKEDEYDKDDDFVDDSEMLWEEQAAASRDGFFVYSGPLVPEVEKPDPARSALPKRGRGSRGGRGGSRGAGTGTGRGRGGGPGSRGGVVRKPRMSKADKLQLEKEKTEREATLKKSDKADASAAPQPPSSPQFAGL